MDEARGKGSDLFRFASFCFVLREVGVGWPERRAAMSLLLYKSSLAAVQWNRNGSQCSEYSRGRGKVVLKSRRYGCGRARRGGVRVVVRMMNARTGAEVSTSSCGSFVIARRMHKCTRQFGIRRSSDAVSSWLAARGGADGSVQSVKKIAEAEDQGRSEVDCSTSGGETQQSARRNDSKSSNAAEFQDKLPHPEGGKKKGSHSKKDSDNEVDNGHKENTRMYKSGKRKSGMSKERQAAIQAWRKRVGKKAEGSGQKTAWNTGKSWNDEMRQKISWTTRLAMSREDVRENVKAGVERKSKISEPARNRKLEELARKQRTLLDKRLTARATHLPLKRIRSLSTFEQREQRYKKYRSNLRSFCTSALMDINMDAGRQKDKTKNVNVPTTKLLMRNVLQLSKPFRGLSERHRKNISNSIAKKWRETKYRKSVKTGMRKFQRARAANRGYALSLLDITFHPLNKMEAKFIEFLYFGEFGLPYFHYQLRPYESAVYPDWKTQCDPKFWCGQSRLRLTV